MSAAIRPRRSILYMPGSNPRALEKGRALAADGLILDLEDAVAPDAKAQGREEIKKALAAKDSYGRRELIVRVNGLDTPWGHADLAAMAQAGADAILLPKVDSADAVRRARQVLAQAGAPESLPIWCMMETPRGILHAEEIADAAGVACFVMGTNDLAKEMHARLTPARTPFLPVLTMTVAAARAHGLVVLDGVCNEFRDVEVFRAEAEQGLDFGFDGKTLIHPDQVDPCNAVFSPSAAELAWADKVVTAFALPENANKGAIKLDDLVIPALSTRRAETTVELGSGQSFAIGGLISNSTRNNLDKVPGLGDVPVLGPLFRSTRFQRSESELVIIVTPYLVAPVGAAQLATPRDGLEDPSDLERLIEGSIARTAPRPGAEPGLVADRHRLVGSAGFMLE